MNAKDMQAAAILPTDFESDEDVDRPVPDVLATFGDLDILINDAGINADKLVSNHPLEDWRRVIRVNLKAPLRRCKAAGSHFLPRKRSVMIGVSSINGLVGATDESSYCASKHGLIGLRETLAIGRTPTACVSTSSHQGQSRRTWPRSDSRRRTCRTLIC